MLTGGFIWQDYVLAEQDASFISIVTIAPLNGYDGRWWRVVEDRNRANGGRIVNYIPRTPSLSVTYQLSRSVLCNLTNFKGTQADGAVRVIDKTGIIPARSWWIAGFFDRPQRGDTLETPLETFFVEDVDVVEKVAPDGVVRDLKYRLALTGASHRRS